MNETQPLVAISVNGNRLETASADIASLLSELGYAGAHVATAVNGQFVSEKSRAKTTVANGDAVEIVSARQGG